jgi:hypothetical protein
VEMLELSKYFHSSSSPKTRAMDGPLLYVNCCSELPRRGKQARWGGTANKMSRGTEAVDIVPAD